MRLFLGLWLPVTWVEELSKLKKPAPGVKWVEKENLHLTLRFLGEVEERKVPGLKKELTCLSLPAFNLVSAGPGAFPSWQQPRVLWWGVRGQTPVDWQRLLKLKRELDLALATWGLAAERGKWQPHITLARFKEGGSNDWQPPARLDLPSWSVRSFALIASTLTPRGPIYRNLCEFSLGEKEEKER